MRVARAAARFTALSLSLIHIYATFSQPDLPPDGIEYVLIGGKIAARHGTIVDAGLGKAVRKL